ncbi:hypothetical protein BGZ63DRAFT_415113 [Mariannaea sp. PMI_226]|nr:hypothetical protein BGZ63DRAFT_415113 [Mariannaea sp. PMI_226]
MTGDVIDQVFTFLHDELSTIQLGAMYWVLFLLLERRNIGPLHRRAIRGRHVLITERPDLHLVWHDSRTFIRPIPLCLLSYELYNNYTNRQMNFLGLMKGLIMHESDYNIAKDIGLMSSTTDRARYDEEVSPQYQYDELRPSRLNFYNNLVCLRRNYLDVHHQYLTFFLTFIGPYLFMLTALTDDPASALKGAIQKFYTFSIVFSILGLAFLPALYLFFQLNS